jgi:hypothetical protein
MAAMIEHLDPWIGGRADAFAGREVYELVSPVDGEVACEIVASDTDELDVGSLWINEGSRFRLDSYPFGGVGASGYGREGVRYAMEEMSQLKFTGIRLEGVRA